MHKDIDMKPQKKQYDPVGFDEQAYAEWQENLEDQRKFRELKIPGPPPLDRPKQNWSELPQEQKERQYNYAKVRRQADPEYRERRNKGDRLRYWAKRQPQLERRIAELQEQLDELMEFAAELEQHEEHVLTA